MQSKEPRTTRGKPRKKRGSKPKPGAVKGKRLKPISLHGMEFNDVIRRLVSRTIKSD
jgi:hypothetical protein